MEDFVYKIPLKELVFARKGSKPAVLKKTYVQDSVPYLDISVLETGRVKEYTFIELGSIALEQDILVVWDGSRSGLPLRGRYGVIGSTLMALTPIELDSDFLYYFLKSKFDFINGNTTGDAIPHVDAEIFFELEVPYYPPVRQKQIASELKLALERNALLLQTQKELISEKLFYSKVDFTKTDDVNQLLESSKQSILKKALSGQVTKKWRKENQRKLILKEAELEQLTDLVTDGEHQTPERVLEPNHNLLLSAKNIRDGYISYENIDYISDEAFQKARIRCAPSVGDILMVSVGATVGRCAIVKEKKQFAIVRSVALIRCNPFILDPEFALLHLQSENTQNIIKLLAKGDAQPSLYINKINSITISYPPLDEQREIVRQVNEIFGEINALQKQYENTVEDLTKLEISILQETFSSNFKEKTSLKLNFETLIELLRDKRKQLEESRRETQKENIKSRNKFKNDMGTKRTIMEILLQKYNIPTKLLFDESIYSETKDIEGFYDDLSELKRKRSIVVSFADDEKFNSIITLALNAD